MYSYVAYSLSICFVLPLPELVARGATTVASLAAVKPV